MQLCMVAWPAMHIPQGTHPLTCGYKGSWLGCLSYPVTASSLPVLSAVAIMASKYSVSLSYYICYCWVDLHFITLLNAQLYIVMIKLSLCWCTCLVVVVFAMCTVDIKLLPFLLSSPSLSSPSPPSPLPSLPPPSPPSPHPSPPSPHPSPPLPHSMDTLDSMVYYQILPTDVLECRVSAIETDHVNN